MSERAYLTSKELADRWRLSDQTLANWRHAGKGPPYIRVGARVLYPSEAIQAFEKLSPNWLTADNIQSEPQST
jgi:predicted site-specific integrase-resolvase